MMQNYPLSIFHASVRPESSPGADLSTFQKITFSLFLGLFGPFRARYFLKKGFHDFGLNLPKVTFLEPGYKKTITERSVSAVVWTAPTNKVYARFIFDL